MKRIFTLLFIVSLFVFDGAKAQSELKMSELSPYFDAYMEPFAGAMAVGMSGGWTTTAEVHQLLGFDISFTGSMVNVPDDARTFDANGLNMPGYSFSGDAANTPSISASNDLSAPRLSKEVPIDGMSNPSFFFDGLKGLGINKGGSAALQATIGLPKGTELMVRFVPDLSGTINNLISNVGDVALSETGMWGIGVKHDIKQWIPVVKSVPFLQLSGMFTYSSFKSGFSGADLRFDPERMGATSSLPSTTWDDQSFDFNMSSFTGALLVGASIPIFQPFIGIGFNAASFEGGFKGNYPILNMSTDINDPAVGQVVVTESEADPLTIDFSETLFNFQAGARVKLGFFVLSYQYTMQKYSMNTIGLGFTFR